MDDAHKAKIEIKNVSLVYDFHNDRTNSLKEAVINFLSRRKYVEEKITKVKALDNVSLTINEGERVGIIGFNGSGKSTMLKVISGILKPSSGTIEVNGAVQPLIEIGAGFDPEFTGRENIYFNSYMLGFTKRQVQAKEQEIVEFADIGPYIDSPIKYYSSGMNVRLAFTIATCIEPEILIIDEMLAAGDAAFIHKAKKRMESVFNVAKIIVIVSHDLSFVESTCTRVIVMEKGQMKYDGNIKEGLEYYHQMIKQAVE